LTLASLGKSLLEEFSSRTGSSETGDRANSTFQEDESLPAPFRAKLQDYFRSGYDRGHMYVVALCCLPSPFLIVKLF
jgi:endonuclease G